MNTTEYYQRTQMGVEQIYEHIRNNPYRSQNFTTRYNYIVDRWVNKVNEVVVRNIKKEEKIRAAEIKEVYSIGSFFNKIYNQ